MRFVKVFHSEAPDFIVGIPEEVEDVDAFLDSVLYGAAGWSEAKDSLKDAAGRDGRNGKEGANRWIKDGSGTIFCPVCGEEHSWIDYRAKFCDTCGAELLPEEGYW